MENNLDLSSGSVTTAHQYASRKILGIPKPPKIITFLIRKGIAKNEQQAGYIILAGVVCMVLLTLYIIFSNGSHTLTIDPSVPVAEVKY